MANQALTLNVLAPQHEQGRRHSLRRIVRAQPAGRDRGADRLHDQGLSTPTAEYTHGRYLFRAGYTGSFFTNENTTLTFDNPWRAVDSTSGSSRGRSFAASEQFVFSVNGMVTAKLPGHSRATAYISGGLLEDAGAPIMPQTVNAALTGINPLPRTTVEGQG
jgi:hypothetical protein